MIFILFPLFILPLINAANFGCEPEYCWETCLNTADIKWAPEYEKIRNLMSSIRQSRFQQNSRGISYLIDRTQPEDNQWSYQRNLMAISAFTTPVEESCNPFFVIGYTSQLAGYGGAPQCRDTCDAASILANMPQLPDPNPTEGDCLTCGCSFADGMRNQGILPCTTMEEKELLLNFMNNENQGYTEGHNACERFTKGRITVDVSKDGHSHGYPDPEVVNGLKLGYTSDLLSASTHILHCLVSSCCHDSFPEFVQRGKSFYEKQSATYIVKGSSKVREVDMSFEAMALTMAEP